MRRFPLVRTLPLLFTFTLLGCLADTDPIVEVRPRLVLPPSNVRFQATNFQQPNLGDMVVRWNRSLSDTQLNFKGYRVHLWTSQVDSLGSEAFVSLIDTALIFQSTGQLDTTVTFAHVPQNRYTVAVWGIKNTDTLKWGNDSSLASDDFDPRPLQNPTDLRATSLASNQVKLKWTLPLSDSYKSTVGYTVYFVDPDNPQDSAIKHQQRVDAHADSAIVSVPNFSSDKAPLKSALEHQYRFFVKSIRNDSSYFYGSDTNSIVWAGAERVPRTAIIDSGAYSGFHNSLFFGDHNRQWDLVDDSDRADAQVKIGVNGNVVTLTTQNGAAFLTNRMDIGDSLFLESVYYSSPLSDVSQFTQTTITLPDPAKDVILYLLIPDPTLANKPEWARLRILKQSNGTYLNSSRGLHIEASFQPGVNKAGDAHLPYY
jgi:hypothetical protein